MTTPSLSSAMAFPRTVLPSLAAGTPSLLNAGAHTSGRGQDLVAAVRGDQLGQDRVGEQGYRGDVVLAHRVPQAQRRTEFGPGLGTQAGAGRAGLGGGGQGGGVGGRGGGPGQGGGGGAGVGLGRA